MLSVCEGCCQGVKGCCQWVCYLQQFAVVRLGEEQLLLVEWVECPSYDRRLLLLDAHLALHDVHLHVGR